MIFNISIQRQRCLMAPIKNPPLKPGADDHEVVFKIGVPIDIWLADLEYATRCSRYYARGCHPDTGERLNAEEFSKIPEPEWRPVRW